MNIRNRLSLAMMCVSMTLATKTCSAAIDEFSVQQHWNFELKNIVRWSKSTSVIEDRDTNNFLGTGFTSAWTENKKLFSYGLSPSVVWYDVNTAHCYVKVQGAYNWITSGKQISYPNSWQVTGNAQSANLEAGGILLVNKFTFFPHLGFQYTHTSTRLHHQRQTDISPIFFIDRDGTKSRSDLFFPYIGIDCTYSWGHLVIGMEYEISYGFGNATTTTKKTVITDIGSSSLYGSRIKYRNLIGRVFEVYADYSFLTNWHAGVTANYDVVYNTNRLPVKYKHNKELVAAGQFTPTQYHTLTEYNVRNYSFTFKIGYEF